MNYIYDILLNFNEKLYDFYDWNKNDNIKHIKKIPIVKVSSKNLDVLKNNQVEFSKQFLEKIQNKTEEFHSKKNKTIEYACLFTDDLEVMAININKKNLYSRLLIDEEIEILDIANHIMEKDLDIKIIKKNEIEEFKTRKQIEQINKAKCELKKLLNENNIEKLKYLYYECFNKKIDSIEKIIKDLNKEIENKTIIEKINNFVNIKNV